MALPKIAIRGLDREAILVQGGMGAGISLAPLAGAVAKRGGVGTVSFVALDRFVERRIGRNVSHREAAQFEIEEARRLAGDGGGPSPSIAWRLSKRRTLFPFKAPLMAGLMP